MYAVGVSFLFSPKTESGVGKVLVEFIESKSVRYAPRTAGHGVRRPRAYSLRSARSVPCTHVAVLKVVVA